MGIRTDQTWRQQFIFFSIVAMLATLLTSRFFLSVGFIGFILFTCIHKNIKQQVFNFITSPLLLSIALLFFLPFLSGLWSDDKTQWLRWTRIKLPLLLFPYAFAGNWKLSFTQWKAIAWIFIAVVVAGCCWSLWQYFQNMNEMNEGYLRARAIPTPLENDHIRFSLLVCIAIITSLHALTYSVERGIKAFLIFFVIFFSIYLHVLFARTGLLAFYLFVLFGIFYLLFHAKNKKLSLVITIAIVVMPLAAWLLLPTFQNRIRYIAYDFSHIRKDIYLHGSNDGTRMVSLKAGWHTLSENPLGVGAGDVENKAVEWYNTHYPEMTERDKVLPASEWLLYGGVAGWPGVVLFTAIMMTPIFMKIRKRFFWVSVAMVSALSLLFDVGLETQFGVFIYAFIVLWWWKWLDAEKTG